MKPLDRRRFLTGLAATALTPALSPAVARALGEHPSDFEPGPVFRHGVASGDPSTRRVVLWTRVTPGLPLPYVKVRCTLYRDAALRHPLKKKTLVTGPWRDYTVKVDVAGLRPGETYYYRFEALGQPSPIGRTRSLANGQPDHLRIAMASCANYPAGFFAAYRHIAAREDLDLVVHLGDYLYEYGEGGFGTGQEIGRVPSPSTEIIGLGDYRERHAQYKTDPDLQEAHRQHPFITVWDDHESANNSWKDGAENHQADEGDWATRKAAAIQAYFEWMPIRERRGRHRTDAPIFRSFRIGDLAQIDMLDTRLLAREEQFAAFLDPFTGDLLVDPAELPALLAELESPARQLLGIDQEAWLMRQLERANRKRVQWSLLGQQVMMAQLQAEIPGTGIRIPTNTDQWDGYPAARRRVLAMTEATQSENLLVLTGDLHSSWTNDIAANPYDPAAYDSETGAGSRGVEFITPGITSPGFSPPVARGLEARILAGNPHTKYVDFSERGYAILDLDRTRARCEWYHVDDVSNPDSGEHLARVAETVTGSRHVEIIDAGPLSARSGSPPPAPGAPAPRKFVI